MFSTPGLFSADKARKSPLRQNQFGFALDRACNHPGLYMAESDFFMGSYEGLRQVRGSASAATIMTPQCFRGTFLSAQWRSDPTTRAAVPKI